MIRGDQVTKMFRSGHDFTSTSSARSPRYFSSSSRYHNLSPSEIAYLHCAYPNPVPILLAAPLEVHEITWKCLDFPALGFSKALLKCFHQPNTRNSSSQSGTSCDISLCTSSDSPFLFLFSVSVDSCSVSPLSSALVLPLLSGTGFSVYLWTSDTESCNEDDEEAGESEVEEELADKPRNTNGT